MMKHFMPRCCENGSILMLLVVASSSLLALPGCKDKSSGPEIVTMEGKVESVKISGGGGEISMTYYNEKHGQEMIGKGLVTKETEIMINGASASLSDIRVGERVRGQARVEKSGDDRKLIVLKIDVERAKPVGG